MAVDKYTFYINGNAFVAQRMKFGWNSLATEDSGRTLDGVMHINWVFRNTRKIEITMPPCEDTVISRIISLVQGKEYNLQYYDPAALRMRTIKVYTSNANADYYSGVVHNGIWRNFEFHAIEIAGDN